MQSFFIDLKRDYFAQFYANNVLTSVENFYRTMDKIVLNYAQTLCNNRVLKRFMHMFHIVI